MHVMKTPTTHQQATLVAPAATNVALGVTAILALKTDEDAHRASTISRRRSYSSSVNGNEVHLLSS